VRWNSERLGLPIQRNGAYKRLEHVSDGWSAANVLMTCRYRFLVLLKKNPPTPRITENMLGVDQNSNGIGVAVIEKRTSGILKQLYLGRDISLQQIRYENRRAKFQQHRDKNGHGSKAGPKLQRLSGRQRSDVRTLGHTFFTLGHTLTHKSMQLGILLVEVPAKHTSQTCPRCGYISRQNMWNWRYFHRVRCGFEANADRVGSVKGFQKLTIDRWLP
jgi:hypothetical protein